MKTLAKIVLTAMTLVCAFAALVAGSAGTFASILYFAVLLGVCALCCYGLKALGCFE